MYSESVIPRIAKAASGVTGTPYNELMNSWGVYFLGFVGKYGYDRILKVRKDIRLRLNTVRAPLSFCRHVRELKNTPSELCIIRLLLCLRKVTVSKSLPSLYISWCLTFCKQ